MTLYLYKVGTSIPVLPISGVISYTDSQAVTEDGTVYGLFAPDIELSSLSDCSEALRAAWRAAHPSAEQRVNELEDLVAGLLFGEV